VKEHFKLKPVSRKPLRARFRRPSDIVLINQSWAAESIFCDILEIDPGNQQVVVMLCSP